MNRRTFLTSTAWVGGTALLAGCSSGGGSGSDGGGTPSPNKQKAANHIDKAAKALDEAADAIAEQGDKFENATLDSGGVDVRTATTNEYLDRAAAELDAAEQYATDEQQRLIDSARDFVAFGRSAIGFLDVFAEAFTRTSNGLSLFQSERYADAAETFESATATFGEAETALEEMNRKHQSIDTEPLSELDQVSVESVSSDIKQLEGLLSAMSALSTGMRHLSLGMVDYTEGVEKLKAEKYAQAQTAFRKARDHFSTAESVFESEKESAPATVQSTFIEMRCIASAIKDASGHFAAAAEALEVGDRQRANEQANKGKEAANRCTTG